MCVGSLCCHLGSSGAYRWHCSLPLSGFDPEGQMVFDRCGAEALHAAVLFVLLIFFVYGQCTAINPLCLQLEEQRGHSFNAVRTEAEVRRVNQVIPELETSVALVSD